jgi:beta-lactamase regulating signal transducer with metallopeptidase domain
LNWLWQGGVVAVVAAGTLHLLDRARATVRCLVCWAALLVVILLPLLALATAAASPAAVAVFNAAPIVTVPAGWWTSSTLIAGVWAIWTSISAIRLARAIVIVRRAKARCRPFSPAVEASLPNWRRARQTGRPARLVLSDRVSAAAVFGGGAPVIAVAPTLIARLDADELDRVVIHEWAHVQRRDDLANIGQLLVRAVAGWHPAVWWLDRRLSIEQELACDETVVAVTGGAKSYASCLVKLASLRTGQSDVLLASGALSSSGLTRRVARLLLFTDFISSAWGRRAAALVAVLLVVLALGVHGCASSKPRCRRRSSACCSLWRAQYRPRCSLSLCAPVIHQRCSGAGQPRSSPRLCQSSRRPRHSAFRRLRNRPRNARPKPPATRTRT